MLSASGYDLDYTVSVVKIDFITSEDFITLFVALLQELVIFPFHLCEKHIASMFFTISYKKRNVWEKIPADKWA